MKKQIYILIALLAYCGLVIAQVPPKADETIRQKMEAERIKYINEKVGFTTEEAALFWSLEGEFKREMRNFHEQSKKLKQSIGENATEKEYRNVLTALGEIDEKILELKESYNTKYLRVIPASKLFKYYEAEMEYKHQLMRKLEKPCMTPAKK